MAKPKKGKRRSWTRYIKRRRTRDRRIPIIKTAVAVAPAMIAANAAWEAAGKNPMKVLTDIAHPSGFVSNLVREYTGMDVMGNWGGNYDSSKLIRNITMWVGGYAASAVANKLGANAAIKRVPLIGKYIKL